MELKRMRIMWRVLQLKSRRGEVFSACCVFASLVAQPQSTLTSNSPLDRITMAGFSRVSILKVLELILACVCIGLHYHSNETKDLHSQMVIMSTFGGFVIILAGVFAGILAGQPLPKRVDMFYSLAGVCLFVASGVLSIEYFNNQYFNTETTRVGIAKGSMAIINGVVFLFDLIFTFRD